MSLEKQKHIVIIHPAGKIVEKVDKETRKLEISNAGFSVTEVLPKLKAIDGYTAGPVLERAADLCYALTMRKYDIVMAARGGMGCTELVPFLEYMLPPVLPDKTLVGFSDISFLGVWLSARYSNLRYIHAHNAYSSNMFSVNKSDKEMLFELLHGNIKSTQFSCAVYEGRKKTKEKKIDGVCVPLNLALAECIACLPGFHFPERNILFLEECNEPLYRILRKIDSLINSNLFAETKAIVLGDFTNCLDAEGKPLSRELLLQIFSHKISLPIIDLPIFGHGDACFPLVNKGKVVIEFHENTTQVTITNQCVDDHVVTSSSRGLTTLPAESIHMTGIGGTGMAQVAGLFQSAGYVVSGSDNPIYPPMDKIISDLGIKPAVGFSADTIKKSVPDAIILANILSWISTEVKKEEKNNEELEEILKSTIPIFSFPAALRHFFLNTARNIIISGTHGKTTTSSLVSHLLTELKFNPSFLVGGQPVNFSAGFALRSRDLFVLEGDEYDCAFFDKGPKFLHYEPKICLINNIEYDHADIYPNIEAIEAEFLHLALLTKERGGIVIANMDDARVVKVVTKSGAHFIGFSANPKLLSDSVPYWKLKSFTTHVDGIDILCIKPNGKEFRFKTGIFGHHNALNAMAALAILQANHILNANSAQSMDLQEYEEDKNFEESVINAMAKFRGVKRRFELLREKDGISVFDDFAHHPTAITTTLEAFRAYIEGTGKKGRLIVCFDPKNATMRRNIFQDDLCKSFSHADLILLGKVSADPRVNKEEMLNGEFVAQSCGKKARYFDDNEQLFSVLKKEVLADDTVVFMSSGSFDGLPARFAKEL